MVNWRKKYAPPVPGWRRRLRASVKSRPASAGAGRRGRRAIQPSPPEITRRPTRWTSQLASSSSSTPASNRGPWASTSGSDAEAGIRTRRGSTTSLRRCPERCKRCQARKVRRRRCWTGSARRPQWPASGAAELQHLSCVTPLLAAGGILGRGHEFRRAPAGYRWPAGPTSVTRSPRRNRLRPQRW